MLAYSFYENDPRVQQYATALVGRGDSVDVICLKRENQPCRSIVDGVNVHRIQSRRRDERGRLIYLYRVALFLFRSAIALTLKHFARPYQLVHIHSVPEYLVFAAVAPKLFGVPVIIDIHDILPEFYSSKFNISHDSLTFKLLVLLERWSLAFADHVIVANHIWERRLLTRSVAADKCTTICNHPDPQLFFPRSRNRSDGKFIITYPGTLNWHQGLDIAIKAFAHVAEQVPSAEFHIYGEGPAQQALKTLALQLGLKEKVKFHAFLPRQEVAELMAQADVGVEPKIASSPFGNEACSTKIPEFMALHVPVVASRTAAHTYYFNDSIVKFFESDSESDLAGCLLSLKRDTALRERLVSNAATYVRENNWNVMKHEYLELVDALVEEKVKARATRTHSLGRVL